MNKKPHKVEEPATPYLAKKPAAAEATATSGSDGVRRMETAAFKKSAAKVFKTHHELLRKLAQ